MCAPHQNACTRMKLCAARNQGLKSHAMSTKDSLERSSSSARASRAALNPHRPRRLGTVEFAGTSSGVVSCLISLECVDEVRSEISRSGLETALRKRSHQRHQSHGYHKNAVPRSRAPNLLVIESCSPSDPKIAQGRELKMTPLSV
jgi:hypothetical protein